MLRCGPCELTCDNYEEWLRHLVSEQHQANFGVGELFSSPAAERDDRSLIVIGMNPRTDPFEVVCHFAKSQALSFITDVFIHIFPHVHDKFYLIIFDQMKFVESMVEFAENMGRQYKVISSVVQCKKKTSMTSGEWTNKVKSSFFYRRHQSLRLKSRELDWNEQITLLLQLTTLDGVGYQKREKVMEELESLFREDDFHEARVCPFGSCTTWLADVNADLDVFVDAAGDGGRGDLGSDEKQKIMKQIGKILRDKYEWNNVYVIKHTRVPIIKLNHPSGLQIDLSFENCLSVQNSKMIRLMTQFDFRVRPLLIFLRYWARYHNLIGPQSVKSYALIMMAFVYLRKRKILPSVHELQNVEGIHPFMVCSWNATYCPSRELTQKQFPWLRCVRDSSVSEALGHEIMKLAQGFFSEFENVDFETQVVCPLTGSYIPKTAFDSQYGVELPKEMELLKANLVTGQCSIFSTERPLCIQDPFTLNINVTSSCSSPQVVSDFQAACAMSAEALKPFIANYNSGGTTCILDLCCQPEVTKKEKIDPVVKVEVKSEVTTTTADCEANGDEWDRFRNQDPASISSSEKGEHFDSQLPSTSASLVVKSSQAEPTSTTNSAVDSTLMEIQEFYSEAFKQDVTIGSRRLGRGRGRRLNDRNESSLIGRDRDRGDEGRVMRVSLGNDKSKVTEYPSKNDTPNANTKEQEERDLKKFVMRVNNSNNNSNSPTHTSTQSPVGLNEGEENKKSLKDIVVVVQNTRKKDFTAQPVVTFVQASAVPTFTQFSTADGDQDKLKKFLQSLESTAGQQSTSVYTEGPSPPQDSPEEEDEAEPNTDPVPDDYGYFKGSQSASNSVTMQQSTNFRYLPGSPYIPPPMRSDSPQSQGFIQSTGPIPQILPTTYSKANSSKKVSAKINFPEFALVFGDEVEQTFKQYFQPVTNTFNESVMQSKMRNFWGLNATAFFGEAGFWHKLESSGVVEEDSFRIVKLVDPPRIEEIFTQIELNRRSFVKSNRKRPNVAHGEAGGNINVSNEENVLVGQKKRKTGPMTQQNTWATESFEMDYSSKSALVTKIGKIPPNSRKNFSCAYIFTVNYDLFECLYKESMTVLETLGEEQLKAHVPLDFFGRLCSRIGSVVDRTGIKNNAPPELIEAKLLIAYDLNGVPPGVYFGFQRSRIMPDGTTCPKEDHLYQMLEELFKDMLSRNITSKLHKYFDTS